MLRENMLGNNHPFFSVEILRLGDVEGSEVREYQHARRIEAKDHAGFLDVGHGDGVEAEADGFSGAQNPTEYTLQLIHSSVSISGSRSCG